ncbi:MAG: NAD(P)/FAD-dependent oxidoreductase [Ancrocorticia sp.]|nr:NAD(P)/FAD-dependent oxidoreductase [Ancrocorticia sp.]MCI2002726.1 NAD(P)/FAD-dependent oxidoreductase [Ancrocorticia sp.]
MRVTEPGRGAQRRSVARIPSGAYVPLVSPHDPLVQRRGYGGPRDSAPHAVDVIVIGAGQAGLCAAYELRRRGFIGYSPDRTAQPGARTFVVLDAEFRPGGAWQHRWPTLTMGSINHIADLPGFPVGSADPSQEAADFIPTYFAEFEDAFDLPIFRPVLVHSVTRSGPGNAHPFLVRTTAGTFSARAIINCTGTWTRPFVPYYPGAASFRGRQFHTQDYPGPRAFEGQRVMIIGGGISALSHLDDVGAVARTLWVTRTPPRWRRSAHPHSRGLTAKEGSLIEMKVRARVAEGLPPLPVVAATGLPISDWTRSLHDRGLLHRMPMFERLTPEGAIWADGHSVSVDSIIWATGFRAELRHLVPLGLRSPHGGIALDDTHVKGDPRIHLIGYGPSASTIGARTAARSAVRSIQDVLDRTYA